MVFENECTECGYLWREQYYPVVIENLDKIETYCPSCGVFNPHNRYAYQSAPEVLPKRIICLDCGKMQDKELETYDHQGTYEKPRCDLCLGLIRSDVGPSGGKRKGVGVNERPLLAEEFESLIIQRFISNGVDPSDDP